MKYIYTTCLASLFIFSASSIFACMAHCKSSDAVQKNSELVFAASQQQKWYLLHNVSKQAVLLNAIISHPSASAGWTSMLDAKRWSLLAYNQNNIKFECKVKSGTSYQKVNCKKFISVCQPSLKAVNENSEGSYWVVENRSLKKVTKIANKRGVVPS